MACARLSKWALLGLASCFRRVSCGGLALWRAIRRSGRLALYLFGNFFCCGMLFGNYNAIAMEPDGPHRRHGRGDFRLPVVPRGLGTGTWIGQLYDGTVMPLAGGFTAWIIAALLLTEWAERRG